MPKYEYLCTNEACPTQPDIFTAERSIHEDDPGYSCYICGSRMRRIFEAPPVRFEGVGFYSTDNPKR